MKTKKKRPSRIYCLVNKFSKARWVSTNAVCVAEMLQMYYKTFLRKTEGGYFDNGTYIVFWVWKQDIIKGDVRNKQPDFRVRNTIADTTVVDTNILQTPTEQVIPDGNKKDIVDTKKGNTKLLKTPRKQKEKKSKYPPIVTIGSAEDLKLPDKPKEIPIPKWTAFDRKSVVLERLPGETTVSYGVRRTAEANRLEAEHNKTKPILSDDSELEKKLADARKSESVKVKENMERAEKQFETEEEQPPVLKDVSSIFGTPVSDENSVF